MSQGRSARGEIVDFDLLKIKQQIASAPPSTDVTRRKDFIENRLRRRTKKPVAVVAPVTVNKEMPTVSAEVTEAKEDVVIEKAQVTEIKTASKQKARTHKTTKKSTE